MRNRRSKHTVRLKTSIKIRVFGGDRRVGGLDKVRRLQCRCWRYLDFGFKLTNL